MLTEHKMRQTWQIYRIFTNTANRIFRPRRYIFIDLPRNSGSKDQRITILVYKHMCWESGNLIKLLSGRYLHSIARNQFQLWSSQNLMPHI